MRLIARGGCWIDNDDDDEFCCCCCCCRCWEVAVAPRIRLLPPVLVAEATTFFHKPLPEEVALETKEPSESNGLTAPTMPLPLPPPLALVALLLLLPPPTPPPPRAADDGATAGAAKGSNGLINGFDIENGRGRKGSSFQFNSSLPIAIALAPRR